MTKVLVNKSLISGRLTKGGKFRTAGNFAVRRTNFFQSATNNKR